MLGAWSLAELPALVQIQSYFGWTTTNGIGRLRMLKVQTSNDPPTVYQDLRYFSGTSTPTYDAAGNLLNIYDYIAGSPQTQTFQYDNLNRLTSAQASGGAYGTYSTESYSYNSSTGNLATKAGVSYSYNAQSSSCAEGALPARPHAVTAAGMTTYCYDQNGNMTTRMVGATTYTQGWDAENRLVSVSGTSVSASFSYDGDGVRVKGTVNGTVTAYVGNWFEWSENAGTTVSVKSVLEIRF